MSHVTHSKESCRRRTKLPRAPAAQLIHICDVTRSYVWRDSFICVTWLMHMCDATHSYVWRDSFICVTWLTRLNYMFQATRLYVRHSFYSRRVIYVWRDSCICVRWLVCRVTDAQYCQELYEWVMSHIWMSHVTHRNESRHAYEGVMSQTHKIAKSSMNESCHAYK